MKHILRGLGVIGLFAGLGSFAGAATMTMDGMISDSVCGASHAKMMQEHKDAKMTDRDCTLACVKGWRQIRVRFGRKGLQCCQPKARGAHRARRRDRQCDG